MATSADIAVASSNYTGTPQLGGMEGLPIQIDTRPIQQLAQYTFLYNRANWEQQQKDADNKISELSKLAVYNPVNGIRKDTQAVIDAKLKLQDAGRKYAESMATNPREKAEQFVKFKQEIGDAENLINSANNRAIAYQVRKNAIMQGTYGAAQKDIELKQLDKEFDDTDIYTKISALPNYQVKNIEVPKPVIQTFDVIGIGANENYETKSTIWNPAVNVPEADRSVLGIKNLYPKKGTPEYDKLSDVEKSQADIQGTVESDGKFWGDMAGNFNAVLQSKGLDGKPLYFDENGEFLKDKFENDNAANTVIMTAYNGLKSVDAYSRKKYDEISAKGGIFDDKGVQYSLPGNLSANDFKAGFIDFNKGISPTQLGLAGIFSKYTGDTFDKKVTPTDNDIQIKLEKMQQAGQTQRERMQQAGQNYRAILESNKKGSGSTTGETRNFMDLTGYTGALTTADIAAIDPTLVVSESGVLKLNDNGLKATFKILPNGDVEVNYNDGKPATDKKAATNATIKVINKGKYQKESVAITQTILKDRKGEEGNPFTFTGIPPQAVVDVTYDVQGKSMTKKELNDLGYTDAQIEEAIKLKTIKKK